MTDDFVSRLQAQLRAAAVSQERRGPVAARAVSARRRMPPASAPVAALLIVAVAVALVLGAFALREPQGPAALKVAGSFRAGEGLSRLATGFGSVWTADPIAGDILRIDPGSRRVVARIPAGGEAQVAVGAGAVWAVAGDLTTGGDRGPVRLLRIDPGTNRVVERSVLRDPRGRPLAPAGLEVDDRAVWAVGVDWARRIGGGSSRFVRVPDRSGVPRGIVADGDGLWWISGAGRLKRLDVRSGDVTISRSVPEPALQLVGGPPGALTEFVSRNRLALLGAERGDVLWSRAFGDDVGWVAYDGGRAWVQYAPGQDAGRLAEVDVGTGRIRRELALPEPGVAGIAKVGRAVWVATPAGRIVVVR